MTEKLNKCSEAISNSMVDVVIRKLGRLWWIEDDGLSGYGDYSLKLDNTATTQQLNAYFCLQLASSDT